MTKKQQIIKDIKNDMKKCDIARKYDVDPSYVSHIIKEIKIKKQLNEYKIIKDMIKRKALKAYRNKMTEEEIKLWETL
jgi:transposase-like protein